ncbi:MAG: hypothetical protein KME32_09475 [Mojavia pulchra JT2-VF2]|jgi:hypothetical protein|uniref:Uncharacterized protein n=1 Tax=Mojavia pulchra JT2-VF2 TaxID=287848 RepID=A0A951PW39_9NOST|nr:hypothetical protein [Mojavia pulchra JT2-VF2]
MNYNRLNIKLLLVCSQSIIFTLEDAGQIVFFFFLALRLGVRLIHISTQQRPICQAIEITNWEAIADFSDINSEIIADIPTPYFYWHCL